jgi:hypothetical protein
MLAAAFVVGGIAGWAASGSPLGGLGLGVAAVVGSAERISLERPLAVNDVWW